jgi:negative regulator of flagellin synthesis FlgM
MFDKKIEVDVARQEKINALKAQVQSGEYQVNSEKAADAFYQYWFDK